MRGSIDAAEYKHIVPGLVFLKYISDAFEAKHRELENDPEGDPEDPEEYLAERIFWVPPSFPPSASRSTRQWMRSRATTPNFAACSPRSSAAPPSATRHLAS
ncbi:MAG: type I restriction-modification system subunit M N-terminal domain-containing protein [Sphingomonadales bacterium]